MEFKSFDSLEIAHLQNSRTLNDYFYQLYKLSINRFKWNGLPQYIESTIEKSYFWYGCVGCIKDEEVDEILFLPFSGNGGLNTYGIFSSYNFYGMNGYVYNSLREDSILSWDNNTKIPICFSIQSYIERICNVQRTEDINLSAQKMPVMIYASDKIRLSIENLFAKISNFNPYVIISQKNFNPDMFQSLDMKAKYLVNDMQEYKYQLLNEVMQMLGIETNIFDKAERQISIEVSSSLGRTKIEREISLNNRKKFCEEVNKKYGTDISVEFNSDLFIDSKNGGEEYE